MADLGGKIVKARMRGKLMAQEDVAQSARHQGKYSWVSRSSLPGEAGIQG